jgi:serine/threonine protein kinase
VVFSAIAFLILLYFLTKQYTRYRKLRKLPVHRTLSSLQISESRVLDAIAKHPFSANIESKSDSLAIELAIKRNVNMVILYELCKICLPFEPESGKSVPISQHQFAWIKLIQKDSNLVAVEIILDSFPSIVRQLSEAEDNLGRTALNLASPKCAQAIRESLYLLKRYEFVNFDDPEHISATCRLHIARDRKNDDEKVALKFMTDYNQFLREIEIRDSMNLSSKYVISIFATYNADNLEVSDQQYKKEIHNRHLNQYPYLIVMPAGTKTLHTVIASEHIAGKEWHKVKEIAIELATALDHLHCNGVIHGDIKPLNIMRVGNTIKLIDLDASAVIEHGYSCAKYSSAYIPPELIHRAEKSCMVKTFKVDPVTKEINIKDLPYALVKAQVSHDAWSYGVVLFELFTGKKLLFADCDDNIDASDLFDVYHFTRAFKQRKLQTIEDPLARNLVSQLLTKAIDKRPNMKQVLAHPFLSGRTPPRMLGEEAEYDVFISYRYDMSFIYFNLNSNPNIIEITIE